MSSENGAEARRQVARLRAVYAVVAGAIVLFGLPFYQAAFLGPAGYATAAAPAIEHGNLAPLLAWIAAHTAADRGFRVLQLIPFLLAMPLPGFLCGLAWPDVMRGGAGSERRDETREQWTARVALWTGRAGFALFALAILVGLLTSAAAAGAYASATSVGARNAALASYATSYLVETLLAQVLGGIALALFLTLVSRRMERTPLYFRLYGYLVAAVLVLNALAFLLDPRQIETPFTTGALFALGLWLVGLGLLLPGILRAAEQTVLPLRPGPDSTPSAGV